MRVRNLFSKRKPFSLKVEGSGKRKEKFYNTPGVMGDCGYTCELIEYLYEHEARALFLGQVK